MVSSLISIDLIVIIRSDRSGCIPQPTHAVVDQGYLGVYGPGYIAGSMLVVCCRIPQLTRVAADQGYSPVLIV